MTHRALAPQENSSAPPCDCVWSVMDPAGKQTDRGPDYKKNPFPIFWHPSGSSLSLLCVLIIPFWLHGCLSFLVFQSSCCYFMFPWCLCLFCFHDVCVCFVSSMFGTMSGHPLIIDNYLRPPLITRIIKQFSECWNTTTRHKAPVLLNLFPALQREMVK